MRAYEIQLFKNNKWEFDSYINDRGTAMAEAERLIATNRHEGVRVIEEEYDPATNKSSCNIMLSKKRKMSHYGRGPARRKGAAATGRKKRTAPRRRRTARASNAASRGAAARKRSAAKRKPNRSAPGALSLMWVALIIVITGIAALIGLQEVAEYL